MKKNAGISLIALIITIIVILILAGIILFEGMSGTSQKAKQTKTLYDVVTIIDAVLNRGLLYKLNPDFYKLVGVNDFATLRIGNSENQEYYYGGGDWYLVSTKDEFSELGLDNVTGEYLFNYKTGAAISLDPIVYEDEKYYSLNDLKNKMKGGSTLLANVEYNSEKGVNKPVLATGMVPVKLSGGNWVVASKDDNDWYDYSLAQMAWANVMLKDELTVDGYTNEQVRNATNEELVGKQVTKEGSSYVWIPRYTASSLGETESDIIFSNLTDDVTSLNGLTYVLPDAFTFTENGEKIDLPGIWVSKYEASLMDN